MSKKIDKEAIAKEICKVAKLYKEHLVGRRFAYVFDGRYIEVLYKTENFKHLTGVTTDLEFSLCMNKEYDDNGVEKGDCYIVESLRDEDCFSKSKSAYPVTHILAKDNTGRTYTDILFIDQLSSIQELPDEVLKMLDGKLLELTTLGSDPIKKK